MRQVLTIAAVVVVLVVGNVLADVGPISGPLTFSNNFTLSGSVLNVNGTPQPIGWIAGNDPGGAPVMGPAPIPYTVTAITANIETAVGTAATVSVYTAPSGVACGSGTPLFSGTIDANGTPATNVPPITLTTTSIPTGNRICLVTTGGSDWTSGFGIGGVTVYVRPS